MIVRRFMRDMSLHSSDHLKTDGIRIRGFAGGNVRRVVKDDGSRTGLSIVCRRDDEALIVEFELNRFGQGGISLFRNGSVGHKFGLACREAIHVCHGRNRMDDGLIKGISVVLVLVDGFHVSLVILISTAHVGVEIVLRTHVAWRESGQTGGHTMGHGIREGGIATLLRGDATVAVHGMSRGEDRGAIVKRDSERGLVARRRRGAEVCHFLLFSDGLTVVSIIAVLLAHHVSAGGFVFTEQDVLHFAAAEVLTEVVEYKSEMKTKRSANKIEHRGASADSNALLVADLASGSVCNG